MKKTILALAVPALMAAGAVNAATVYDQDGVAVTIGGAAEVQLIQNYEFEGEDENLDVRLDDGELNFGVEVAVSDSLTALGYYDFEYEDGSVDNDELYAGFKGDFGKVTIGRQYTFWDDTGIGEDIELGVEGFSGADAGSVVQDGVTLPLTIDVGAPASGDNVIKYRYDADAFWFGISHNLKGDNAGEFSATDAGVGTTVAGVDLSAYYSTSETEVTLAVDSAGSLTSSNKKYDTDAWQFSAVYNVDAFTVGASYTKIENNYLDVEVGGVDVGTIGSDIDVESDLVELLLGYGAGDFQYYLGYNFGEIKDVSDLSNIYANVTYKLHSNVKTYVEAGWTEIDPEGGKSDDATGFLVGMEVKF
ncbi:porin [Enterovibrio norvegicus]|uniref:porin n=1 Tax=Enterovibrio norvegicus TaxID=188144 RepID=UPI0024B061CA|nr:porin [Enterovibrio norvegicus]